MGPSFISKKGNVSLYILFECVSKVVINIQSLRQTSKKKIVIRELRNLNQLTNFNSIYVLGLAPSFNHSLLGSMLNLITFACSEEMAEDMVGERGDRKIYKNG